MCVVASSWLSTIHITSAGIHGLDSISCLDRLESIVAHEQLAAEKSRSGLSTFLDFFFLRCYISRLWRRSSEQLGMEFEICQSMSGLQADIVCLASAQPHILMIFFFNEIDQYPSPS